MSEDSRFVAESLEALLVSIASGVRDAQDALSEAPPLDAFGRPMPTYHLPYLDFEVKVEAETVKTAGGAVFLRVGSFGADKGNSSQEISSTISGRLVAVPAGEGLPTPILTMTSLRLSSRRHRIVVTAMNSAGEILAGQGIELNINMVASRELSEAQGADLNSARSGTGLDDVILVTDEAGSAETILNIDSSLSAKIVFVLTAELGMGIASLTVAAGAG